MTTVYTLAQKFSEYEEWTNRLFFANLKTGLEEVETTLFCLRGKVEELNETPLSLIQKQIVNEILTILNTNLIPPIELENAEKAELKIQESEEKSRI